MTPDLLASAKGLGGRFPIGTCLATERVAQVMVAGSHGSTFGGNPLVTAVANAVLDELTAAGFLSQVSARIEQLRSGLDTLIADYPHVVRAHTGLGLMVGLICEVSNSELVAALQQRQLLTVKAGGNSIRLLPPLNISAAEIALALNVLRDACQQFAATGQLSRSA